MSYIDIFQHEYLGHLGYLPIYHPLENIEEGGDFNATPANLILGGGSGEHPALVIHHLESLVAHFLSEQISDQELDKIPKEDRDFFCDLLSFYSDSLEFCGWSVDRYIALNKMAKSTAFITALKKKQSVEEWLCLSLGEFVFFSLPELNAHHERLVKIFSPFCIPASICNVSFPPPGYPLGGGFRIVDGKPVYGQYR